MIRRIVDRRSWIVGAFWLLLLAAPAQAARIFTSGFETNNLTETEYFSPTGPPSISSAWAHSGTYSLLFDGNAVLAVRRTFDANRTSGTVYTRYYIRFVTFPSAAAIRNLLNTRTTSGSNSGARILFGTVSGSKYFRLDNTITTTGVTGSYALSTGQTYRLELRQLIADTGGEIELRIYLDEQTSPVETLSITNEDTLSTGVGQIVWMIDSEATNREFYIDDIAINDSTTGNAPFCVCNSWPGPGKTALLKPSSDVSVAWTKAGSSPAAANWEGVDDVPGTPNDGIDYNQDAETTNIDKLGMTDLPAEVPSDAQIKVVHVFARVGSDGTSARTMILKAWTEAGGACNTQIEGPSVAVNISGWKIPTTAELAPFDASGKSKANIANWCLGYKGNGGSNRNKFVSALWANVEWTEAAAPQGIRRRTVVTAQ